jgi:hypothetical protein
MMPGDWPYWLREHRGTLLALAAFLLMFTIYASNHPAGLNANVAQTAANKGPPRDRRHGRRWSCHRGQIRPWAW